MSPRRVRSVGCRGRLTLRVLEQLEIVSWWFVLKAVSLRFKISFYYYDQAHCFVNRIIESRLSFFVNLLPDLVWFFVNVVQEVIKMGKEIKNHWSDRLTDCGVSSPGAVSHCEEQPRFPRKYPSIHPQCAAHWWPPGKTLLHGPRQWGTGPRWERQSQAKET